jgi:translation initiation factor 2 gamma subunit (eIF-2gamma)
MGKYSREEGKKRSIGSGNGDTMTVSKKDLENLHTKVDSIGTKVDTVVTDVAEIRGSLPHMATKDSVKEEIGKHVVDYHGSKSFGNAKVITAIVLAIGSLSAAIVALTQLL